ncbi:MAG: vWA domain-containing protein [Pseudomonadota bacterium]
MRRFFSYDLSALIIVIHLCRACSCMAENDPFERNNVIIILDSSGSMSETMRDGVTIKMAVAKAALKEVLRQAQEDIQIGLLVFSSSNLADPWVYPLGPRNDAELLHAIDLPEPGGQTPLGAYIKIGADRLLEQKAKQYGYGTYRLLIVTDGEANDQHLVDRYTPEVIARGVTVDVIGVNMITTHTLATQAHSYRRADDPDSLKTAISEVFAEVANSPADTNAAEAAFSEIAPIPDELATAMLRALAASGNHPIGETPITQQSPKPGPFQQPAPDPTPVPTDDKGDGFQYIIYLIVLVIVVFKILTALRRFKQRGRQ